MNNQTNVPSDKSFESFGLYTLVPLIGIGISFLLYGAPFRTVYNAAFVKHTFKGLNPIPYPILLGNAVMWLYYSCLLHNMYIYWSNAPGIIITAAFTLFAYSIVVHDHLIDQKHLTSQLETRLEQSTLWYKVKTSSKLQMELILLIDLILLLSYVLLINYVIKLETALILLGITANISTFIMYASPLITMYRVIKTKCATSIDPILAAMQTINSVIWLTYGLALKDPLIWSVAIPGILFGFIQIILLIIFRNYTPTKQTHPSVVILDGDLSSSNETIAY